MTDHSQSSDDTEISTPLIAKAAPAASPNRTRLPNRRPHESFAFSHAGIRYTAGIGRFDDGRPGEIFLNAGKVGTDVSTIAADGAIVISLALQHGADVDTIRRALTRNPDGSASGPLGAALDKLASDAPEAA